MLFEDFEARAKALVPPGGWETHIAKRLGIDSRQVRRWRLKGQTSAWVAERLAALERGEAARPVLPYATLPTDERAVLDALLDGWLVNTGAGRAVVSASDGDKLAARRSIIHLINLGYARIIKRRNAGNDTFQIFIEPVF